MFLTCIISLGTVTNLAMMCNCARQVRSLKTTVLLSMTAADFVQCVVGYTLQLVINEKRASDFLCVAAAFHLSLLGLVSILHFVVLFLERTVRIITHSRQHPLDKKKYWIIAAIWLYALVWAVAPLLGWGSYQSKVVLVYNCSVRVPNMSLKDKLYFYGLIFFVFILSVLAILFLYAVAKYQLNKNLRKLVLCSASIQISILDSRRTQIRRFDRMTLTMTVIFIGAWTPFACVTFYQLTTGRQLPDYMAVGAPLLAKSCVFFNPFVYAYYYLSVNPKVFFWIVSTTKKSRSSTTTSEIIRNTNITPNTAVTVCNTSDVQTTRL